MSWTIDVQGVAKLVNQLEKFDKDVSKELKAAMRLGAGKVADAAMGMTPSTALRNWGKWTYSRDGRDLGFSQVPVMRGFYVATERTRNSGVTIGFGYSVRQRTAAGAIYELAGSQSDEPMSRAINRKHPPKPKYPRTLFPAYYKGMPQAITMIEKAVRDAERKVGR